MPESIIVTPRPGRRSLTLQALKILSSLGLIQSFKDRSKDEVFQSCYHDLVAAELSLAIAHNELLLHYQPIVDLQAEGTPTVGHEALVRWQHPKRGLLMPGEFIAIAEESRLIFDLFQWVVTEACQQLFRWKGQYWVAVNASPRQFAYGDTAEAIAQALRMANVDASRLHIEITESETVQGSDFEAVLRQLTNLGVLVILDDFGTAYASYARVLCMKISALKVDKAFLGDGDRATAVYRSIIQLGHSLGLKVIGEGVETQEQAEQLKAAGCDYGQGFYFGRPEPPRS